MRTFPKEFYDIEFEYVDKHGVDFGDRKNLAVEMHKLFWPHHCAYWINSSEDYEDIQEKLEQFRLDYRAKHLIIAQTEEDFLYNFNVEGLRGVIKQYKHWTNRSFVLTNSYKDYKQTSKFIRCMHKPGLLDLVAYRPYYEDDTKHLLNFETIDFHTGFFYNRDRASRQNVVNILKEYPDEISAMYWMRDTIVENIDIDKSVQNSIPDAPFAGPEYDAEWVQYSAFIIALETLNNSVHDIKVAKYAPTLSEKTFKAMHLYRPALIYGGRGTRKKLKQLGFDTWDWLIDWSFDEARKGDQSLAMFQDELIRLLNIDVKKIVQLMQENKNALIHNKRHVINLVRNYNDGRTY